MGNAKQFSAADPTARFAHSLAAKFEPFGGTATMRVELDIHSESGAFVVADRANLPSAEILMSADRSQLRQLAQRGDLFFLDAEDPAQFRVLVCVEEEHGLPKHRYQQVGGSFLLNLPSGNLAIADVHQLQVFPGPHALTVLQQAVVDARAIEGERQAVLTAEQWRYRRWVEKLHAVGCLLFLAAWITVFFYRFSLVSLVAVLVAVCAAIPSYLLTRTRRYQQTERQLAQHDRSYPAHALVIRSIADASGLSGGHHVIQ